MPSSVICAFDYRPAARELEILFTTGRRYTYHGVPSGTAAALGAAPSRGRFFNAHIRNHYPFTCVRGAAKRRVNGA